VPDVSFDEDVSHKESQQCSTLEPLIVLWSSRDKQLDPIHTGRPDES
jgi:hypothetical protein